MRDGFEHWHWQSVRWGDMDAMGHVNNAAFFTYMESARMSYFEAIATQEHRQDAQHGPAVVHASCNFRQQLHYPAELAVGARVSEIGRTSFTFEIAIYRDHTDEIVADGKTVMVWVDYGTGKPAPLPESLKQAIRRYQSDAT